MAGIRRISSHRRWLESRGKAGIRITGRGNPLTIKGLTLDHADLSFANLTAATFKDCNLRNASFIESNLACANFIRCDLTGARFDRAVLIGAQLGESSYNGASFDGANTEGTGWTLADAAQAHYEISTLVASVRRLNPEILRPRPSKGLRDNSVVDERARTAEMRRRRGIAYKEGPTP